MDPNKPPQESKPLFGNLQASSSLFGAKPADQQGQSKPAFSSGFSLFGQAPQNKDVAGTPILSFGGLSGGSLFGVKAPQGPAVGEKTNEAGAPKLNLASPITPDPAKPANMSPFNFSSKQQAPSIFGGQQSSQPAFPGLFNAQKKPQNETTLFNANKSIFGNKEGQNFDQVGSIFGGQKLAEKKNEEPTLGAPKETPAPSFPLFGGSTKPAEGGQKKPEAPAALFGENKGTNKSLFDSVVGAKQGQTKGLLFTNTSSQIKAPSLFGGIQTTKPAQPEKKQAQTTSSPSMFGGLFANIKPSEVTKPPVLSSPDAASQQPVPSIFGTSLVEKAPLQPLPKLQQLKQSKSPLFANNTLSSEGPKDSKTNNVNAPTPIFEVLTGPLNSSQEKHLALEPRLSFGDNSVPPSNIAKQANAPGQEKKPMPEISLFGAKKNEEQKPLSTTPTAPILGSLFTRTELRKPDEEQAQQVPTPARSPLVPKDSPAPRSTPSNQPSKPDMQTSPFGQEIKEPERRERSKASTFERNKDKQFPIFDSKPRSTTELGKEHERSPLSLTQLFDVLNASEEKALVASLPKIEASLKTYLTIELAADRTYEDFRFVPGIEANAGVNKLLNDFSRAIGNLLRVPKTSYKAFGQLFHRMLIDEKFADKLLIGDKLREDQIRAAQMYKVGENNAMVLEWQLGYASELICEFILYFSSLMWKCLKKLQQQLRLFTSSSVFELFAESILLMARRYPQTENASMIESLRQGDIRISGQMEAILLNLLESWYGTETRIQFVSQAKLCALTPVVDQLPLCPATKIFQLLVLKSLRLDRPDPSKSRRLIEQIGKTSCKVLLPFRVIIHRLDKTKRVLDPFQKQLFQMIDGPEWIDWLSLYLGEDNLRFKDNEITYILKALKKMRVRNVDKILSKESQVSRLIHVLAQQGQTRHFYEAISCLIYDEQSLARVEAEYFKQSRTLHNDLKLLANQVRKYPNCEYIEEDLPDLWGKAVYFLTTLAIAPEKAFKYENALFDVMGFIDVESERCDRVCHLVVDTLAYFTNRDADDEIVVKAFDALIALTETSSTRPFISLAMNVNRPQFDFLGKNLHKSVLQKINSFLVHLVSSKQFYDSTREPDQSLSHSRSYPFRYSIEKYLVLNEFTKETIPFYWFSNCLKISIQQAYNPELLEMILSKLKIDASRDDNIEIPFLLMSVVDACNASAFWKNFSQVLAGSSFIIQNRIGVARRSTDESNQRLVFYSLKLLKTLLQLRCIRNKTQVQHPRHFVSQLLSSLHCLNELDRYYIQSEAEIEFTSQKNISPIICLLSLVCDEYSFINSSADLKTQWLFNQNVPISIEDVKKVHTRLGQNIDYSIIRDVLAHPFTKYLDCLENVASLAFDCLSRILTQAKDFCFENLLYMHVPKKNNSSQDFENLKKQIVIHFLRALEHPATSLSRNSWRLLLCMRRNEVNKKLSQEIFRQLIHGNKSYLDRMANLKQLAEFILLEAKDGIFVYSEITSELLEAVAKKGVKNIFDFFEDYEAKGVHVESLHQFERLMLQRNMLVTAESYDLFMLLMDITLSELYYHSETYYPSFTRHSSTLFKIISDCDLVNIFNIGHVQTKVGLSDDQPRTHKQDILERYIMDASTSRQRLAEIQVANVLAWFKGRVQSLEASILSFMSVLLSIDDTYYANHEIKIRNRKNSELFCQLHMGVVKYRACEIVSVVEKQAINTVKSLIDQHLVKIERVSREGIVEQTLKAYALIDLLLCWLRSCKGTKKVELTLYAKKVLVGCFGWLGSPLIEPQSAKLLMTCTQMLQGQLTQDIITNLKETISKTVESVHTRTADIKQEMLVLLLLTPPDKNETTLMEMVAKMWCSEENNQYFFNQSRVLIKLCSLYPIEMAKLKILDKCERIGRYQDSNLQSVRYKDGLRTTQCKAWIWVLKIASTLMENGSHSTIVVHEVSKFVQSVRKRICHTLNQSRQELNSRSKSRDITLELSLAQLDELEATLELLIVVSESKMWVEINRTLFQEFLYCLMHRTIVLFAPRSMAERVTKRYIPHSINEKIMWKLAASEGGDLCQSGEYGPIEEEYLGLAHEGGFRGKNVFIASMMIRFNQCLKLWLLACSAGMRNSCFVREYFTKPINAEASGSALKYSLTHWEHLNKAILEIAQGLVAKLKDFSRFQINNQVLGLVVDAFNSAEIFTETGYLYSMVELPCSEEKVSEELSTAFSLVLEMGACHLVSQTYFRNKNGTFSRENLSGFREKLLKLGSLLEERLAKNTSAASPLVLEQLASSRDYLRDIKV